MQRKLFISYIVIILVAVGVSSATFWSKGYKYINEQSKANNLREAKILADSFIEHDLSKEEEFIRFVNEHAEKYQVRITLIDSKGDTIADSQMGKDENHIMDEEVIKALAGESVSETRYSKTAKQDCSYSAVPVSNEHFNGVLRLSIPISKLTAFDDEFISIIPVAVLICLSFAFLVAFYFTSLISKPLNEITMAAEEISNGNYGIKIYTREKGQIARLAKAFNLMTTNLNTNVHKLTLRNVELEAMLSSMTSSVVAIDETNTILFYNKSFTKLTETTSQSLTGRHLYNTMRNAIVLDAIDDVRKNKEIVIKEGYYNQGENKIIRVTATHLSSETGKTIGVLLIIDDITQIKKLENIRKDFVSNVTHELKTPLTSIRGFIDTLKNGAINDEKVAKKFLDIIDIEAERLSDLIGDILILSEIESKRDYEVTEHNVEEIIQSAIHLLQPKMIEKQIHLNLNIESDLKQFRCNPDRIKQLLINLLDNAIKYTEEGSITIECYEDNNFLELQIIDTGIGIEEEHHTRIFERFYRVDKGRSRKQGGTGLGLSIVKHIVELYGGTITIESKVQVGTKFNIRLPYDL